MDREDSPILEATVQNQLEWNKLQTEGLTNDGKAAVRYTPAHSQLGPSLNMVDMEQWNVKSAPYLLK